MKYLQILISGLCLAGFFPQAKAQTVNWKNMENTAHMITLGLGWDYSLSYNIGYAYHPAAVKMPLVINANFSMPSGEKLLDDFKLKLGGQIVLLNHSNFKGGISLNGIYRRFENPLTRLLNFGAEMKGRFGYYKNGWFVAGELGFDKAVITHFKHSDLYKQDIYEGVRDGWYNPATGGNFLYGLQAGYSFNKSDITLDLGKITTQDFKTTPRIPYYLALSFNLRIN
ncbi:hypothetical protein COR50_20460 [Chitinophaga caeni]|uniref:Outer membrane protein beta-barrel domain-containing protein n=1 Tax=Chitinophaga caeni TaxID=2029983 RepID=A0A291QZI5_9BACT|nr:hypothetical protein [Chitinophaga caeni]ATL49358.1 hypothetical protein COR50_20460 [Chitinophaga caeni]